MTDTSSKTEEKTASGDSTETQTAVPQNNKNSKTPSGPAFVVHRQYVKDLSFESPNAVQALMPNAKQPSVSIQVDINGRRLGAEEALYEVSVDFRVRAVSEGETAKDELLYFILELTYCTLLTVGEDVPKEHQDYAAMVEGGMIGFPFARAIIAQTIQEGGFPALYLTPINFPDLIQSKARQIAEQRKQAASKPSSETEASDAKS